MPAFTLLAALGALAARRRDHREVWDLLGVDRPRGEPILLAAGDLYPDAAPCLADLRARGLRIAIAGNQPQATERVLVGLGLPADVIASSEGLGVAKPDPRFFALVARLLGVPAGAVASVGDRLDNDVLPAEAAGMLGIHIRRGPWGVLHDRWPEAARADLRIRTLAGLGDRLAR